MSLDLGDARTLGKHGRKGAWAVEQLSNQYVEVKVDMHSHWLAFIFLFPQRGSYFLLSLGHVSFSKSSLIFQILKQDKVINNKY